MPETKHKSRLTPVRFLYRKPNKPDKYGYKSGYAVYWEYKCACGKVVTKNKKNVDDGFKGKWRGTKSCGCLRKNRIKKIFTICRQGLRKDTKSTWAGRTLKECWGRAIKGKYSCLKTTATAKTETGDALLPPKS